VTKNAHPCVNRDIKFAHNVFHKIVLYTSRRLSIIIRISVPIKTQKVLHEVCLPPFGRVILSLSKRCVCLDKVSVEPNHLFESFFYLYTFLGCDNPCNIHISHKPLASCVRNYISHLECKGLFYCR
jgi:hypothetical protein